MVVDFSGPAVDLGEAVAASLSGTHNNVKSKLRHLHGGRSLRCGGSTDKRDTIETCHVLAGGMGGEHERREAASGGWRLGSPGCSARRCASGSAGDRRHCFVSGV